MSWQANIRKTNNSTELPKNLQLQHSTAFVYCMTTRLLLVSCTIRQQELSTIMPLKSILLRRRSGIGPPSNQSIGQGTKGRLRDFQDFISTPRKKMIHGLFNTNKQNSLYYGTTPLCLIFEEFIKSQPHVFHCPHDTAITCCKKALKTLETTLHNTNTPPTVVYSILYGLQEWALSPDMTHL